VAQCRGWAGSGGQWRRRFSLDGVKLGARGDECGSTKVLCGQNYGTSTHFRVGAARQGIGEEETVSR
jgi:hypothetical protein